MNKQDIHNRIEKILIKLQNLNQNISTDEVPDSVELDLFNAYLKNLSEQSDLLETIAKSIEVNDTDEQSKIETPHSVKDEEKTEIVEPEVSVNSEEIDNHPQTDSSIKSESNTIGSDLDNEKNTIQPEKAEPVISHPKPSEINSDIVNEVIEEEIVEEEEKQLEPLNITESNNEKVDNEDSINPIEETPENFPEKINEEREVEEKEVESKTQSDKGSTSHLLRGKDMPLSIHDKLTSGNSKKEEKLTGIGRNKRISLKELFDLNDRFTYSKILFNSNMELFSQAIKEIGSLENGETAIQYMEENYAEKFNWETNQPLAERFKDKISYFFDVK